MNTNIRLSTIVLLCSLLVGCAATHTTISKRNLDVQTKMSETIFLDPVAPELKTVYVQIRNTSGSQQLDMDKKVAQAIANKGYLVVNDPTKAHYMVQANVLQVSKADLTEAEDILEQGFGGGLLGVGIAAVAGGNGRAIAGAGMVGAAVNMVANAMVKDNFYTIVTDVQISERAGNLAVKERFDSNLPQGSTTRQAQTGVQYSDWKRYQTRIVSTANKVNLQLEEAIPELVAGLSHSISGLM